LLKLDWLDNDGHFSCASKAPNQDWCYIDTESKDDTFTSMGTWRAGKQEIMMVQTVAPYTVRRLAHHRSRQLDCSFCTYGGYFYQPRLSASWDGTKVAWASNFNYNAGGTEYVDIYVIAMPALGPIAQLEAP